MLTLGSWWILGLTVMTGCKLDEDTYRDRYDDKYCDVLENECGGECREQTDEVVPSCDFDQDKAKECLDGEWECVPLGTSPEAPELPQGPAACAEVFTNCEL